MQNINQIEVINYKIIKYDYSYYLLGRVSYNNIQHRS